MVNEVKYVVDIMTPNPVVVGPKTTTWLAESLAQRRSVHDLLVLDGYRLAGVVCRCDLQGAGAETHVEDCMRRNLVTIDDQETAEIARHLLEHEPVGCLPVLDWTGRLCGVVTRRDLVNAGIIERDRVPSCSACGSLHGLPRTRREGGTLFCRKCMDEQRMPRTSSEEAYFDIGGGD